MRYIRQLCCVSLLCLSGSAVAANVRLQVEGLSGQLEKNVRAQLSTIESDEVTPDRRFRARVDDAIREGLKALGYYEPTIDFDLRPPLMQIEKLDHFRMLMDANMPLIQAAAL